MLAIAFGCEKFHQHIYGTHVHIETDHKPLEAICKKPLVSKPRRLPRLMLRIQKFNKIVSHTPGKELLVADELSCAYLLIDKLPHVVQREDAELQDQVHMVTRSLPMSEGALATYRKLTRDDVECRQIIHVVQSSLPGHQRQLPQGLRQY